MLPGLLSRSQVVAASDGDRRDMFNERTFHDHLVKFIVANDQVCRRLVIFLIFNALMSTFKSLNVVECQEFRVLLLLLRSELKESMIPHRTKIRELVIRIWKEHFQVLKQDLSVGPP